MEWQETKQTREKLKYVYPRISSIPFGKVIRDNRRNKIPFFDQSFRSNLFPLLIIDTSSYPIRAFFRANRSFFFLSFFLCPVVHDERRPKGNCSWKDKGTQRDPLLCRGAQITIVSSPFNSRLTMCFDVCIKRSRYGDNNLINRVFSFQSKSIERSFSPLQKRRRWGGEIIV